jgi:oligopeptidase A
LPRDLYDKMIAARNFQSGMQLLRQVEFALIDIRLHAAHGLADAADVHRIVDDVRREVAVVQPPAWNRMISGFTHIFAGGYAAGYYSYKWAEVLSADCYAAFEETAQAGGSTLDAAGRPTLPRRRARRGRQPAGAGLVHRLPWPRAADRRPAAP